MARTDPQFNLRIPSELKDRLEGAAKDAGRSVTAEIIQRLEASFPLTSFSSDAPFEPFKRVERMAQELQEVARFIREADEAIREEIERRDHLEREVAQHAGRKKTKHK